VEKRKKKQKKFYFTQADWLAGCSVRVSYLMAPPGIWCGGPSE
jgi:hypothetical protein